MTKVAARRLAWSLWALAVAVTTVSVVFLVLTFDSPSPAGQFGPRGFSDVFAVIFATTGAVVASRRSENAIGWILLGTGIGSALQALWNNYAIYALVDEPGAPGGTWSAWFLEWTWIPLTGAFAVVFLLFPSGHAISARWRWLLVASIVTMAVASVANALVPQLPSFGGVPNPIWQGPPVLLDIAGATLALFLMAQAAGAVGLVVRFRRSSGEERLQLKWLVLAAGMLSLSLGLFGVVAAVGGVEEASTGADWLENLVVLSLLSIPVTIGIAIQKYRLYDVDLVINKTVVYGALAVFITLVYVAIVVGVGAAIGARSNTALSAAAAAVIALVFQPARRRAQHLANRLVYGKRATPYEVLSELPSRFASTYSLEDALPRLARVTAKAVGADLTTVWLRADDELVPVAAWPFSEGVREAVRLSGEEVSAIGDAETRFPVRHQGELLGAISVTMPSNEPLSPAQAKLLADVAAHAGLVLRNVALVADLRASRQRIVAAQDERARKLERDIHDGAQQQLVALSVKLRLAGQVARSDGEKAAAMMADLQQDATDALENLRDLARGIYPPLLADKGLATAIEAQARKSPLPASFDTDGVGRYAQEVEAAVYFCVLEALQNVAKYASANRVVVRLGETDGDLRFAVEDDGVGFDPGASRGTGLTNMRDRLEALGGSLELRSSPGAGTTVAGRISVTPKDVAP
jgi:signal transduction histidine kinase